jgi:hypothetical protein
MIHKGQWVLLPAHLVMESPSGTAVRGLFVITLSSLSTSTPSPWHANNPCNFD